MLKYRKRVSDRGDKERRGDRGEREKRNISDKVGYVDVRRGKMLGLGRALV